MSQPWNDLTVHAYERWSTTVRHDPLGQLDLAMIEQFTTFYPGGLFGMAILFIPGDPSGYLCLHARDRVEIWNGSDVVWEGEVLNIAYQEDPAGDMGFVVELAGAWGQVLGRTLIDKRWADNRLDPTVWYFQPTSAPTGVLPEKFSVDRQNRIHVAPKAEAFTQYDRMVLHYAMPYGQTIKRITWNHDLDEGAQVWRITLKRATAEYTGTAEVNVEATGTDDHDNTLGAYTRWAFFEFASDAAQTPPQSGSGGAQIYLEISGIVVYSETGSINLTEIAKDVIGLVSDLASSTSFVGSNTLSLVPFFTNGPEYASDILMRAAAFGDASYNSWAVYLRESAFLKAAAGKPVLFVEQYPALTDYDYQIDLNEFGGRVDLLRDTDRVANTIQLAYYDDGGILRVVTPDEDSGLKDQDSIDLYGARHLRVDAGSADETTAKNLAKRILADRKDARFKVNGSIDVPGYILAKDGRPVPAANIRAGKRLRIKNYLDDLAGTGGAGLTFLISETNYDARREVCSIMAGIPDALEVILPNRTHREPYAVGYRGFAAPIGEIFR